MTHQNCSVPGCARRATFHVFDGTSEQHLCEVHAAELLGGGHSSRANDGVSSDNASRRVSITLNVLAGNDETEKTYIISDAAARLIRKQTARECCVVPLTADAHGLTVAAPRETREDVRERVRFVANRQITWIDASRASIEKAIDACYGKA